MSIDVFLEMPKKPKKILNDPQKAVEEFIEGLLLQYPNHLVKVANHNVVLLANASNDAVQVFSGGGSGHEPSHAGWIGSGMLTGAICGGIFASPSVASILAGIRAAQPRQSRGVILIVKNYTGDRLNFGMAAEILNQQGTFPVQVVIVADDCALPRTKGITGARGVAGTVLVHKIAGAAAASGKTLDEVSTVAKCASSRMGTLGIAMDAVTVPGADSINDRLDDDNVIEIGLGIHGEAGMRQSALLTADNMAREMISTICSHGRVIVNEDNGEEQIVPLFTVGDEVCVLVNNLGGTSNFEMSILTRSCVKLLEGEWGVKATRVFVGSYMTSFDMHGASLTILNVTGEKQLLEYLDAPTNAPAWRPCDIWKSNDGPRSSSAHVPEVVTDNKAGTVLEQPDLDIEDFANKAMRMATAAAKTLAESEPLLTKYDTIVGDGDCGITMKRGATEVLRRIENGEISTDHPVPLFAGIADAVSASMGGTSGILLELMFRKISSTLLSYKKEEVKIGVPQMCHAFQAGVNAVQFYGGANIGSRTMLDALVPGALSLVAINDLCEAARKAREGADGTASMKSASAGRSNYLSEETLLGTPDPGAVAVAIVLESLAQK